MKGPENTITLLELNQAIRFEIKEAFADSYWVVAEISEVKENRSGHCYLELIEKKEGKEYIVAKARATVWAAKWLHLRNYFETTARHAFSSGIKVMLLVTVEFHELYGLSLNVLDIDPVYTLGDLMKQKQETILRLKQEGVFHMNKETDISLIPQRIAVISSETAAGYGDFVDQLCNNSTGYKFYVRLFPAIMQGEDAITSIISALESIYRYEAFFDLVVIIRGGGSKTDLSCFDSYRLAYHVAQYPLPVITGIGHEQDDTVTDMVAHTRLKTPTAVASFIYEKLDAFDAHIEQLSQNIRVNALELLSGQHIRLAALLSATAPVIRLELQKNSNQLNLQTGTLKNIVSKLLMKYHKQTDTFISATKHQAFVIIERQAARNAQFEKLLNIGASYFIDKEEEKIAKLEQITGLLNPQHVLDRGYSITLLDGKALTDARQTQDGDLIETVLKNGKINSVIKKHI